MVERPWTRVLAGAIVAISGVLLALPLPLPLPLPFSNALPAYAILLTGLGLAQHDGLAILIGQGVFLGTLVFFAAIAWAAVAGVQMIV